jgi:hypothetical protein
VCASRKNMLTPDLYRNANNILLAFMFTVHFFFYLGYLAKMLAR